MDDLGRSSTFGNIQAFRKNHFIVSRSQSSVPVVQRIERRFRDTADLCDGLQPRNERPIDRNCAVVLIAEKISAKASARGSAGEGERRYTAEGLACERRIKSRA